MRALKNPKFISDMAHLGVLYLIQEYLFELSQRDEFYHSGQESCGTAGLFPGTQQTFSV